jgi:hypothetical protein
VPGVASIHYTESGAEDQPLLDTAVAHAWEINPRRSSHPDFCATSGPKTQVILCNVSGRFDAKKKAGVSITDTPKFASSKLLISRY